ncbi:MAG: phage shock protein C PspC [Ignavibacteria bacterium]|nr:MAG: phage shock protein C PspC [Ignavibacteria bacterium]KAF0161141.1 MAG: phage shock protein C PspC [Ignavibacteria bacterium]
MKERLFRSRKSRVIGGVAGGLAQYFSIDPVIVRILFVVLTIMHGMGLVIYIILWIAVPEEPFAQAYGINPEGADKPDGSDVKFENLNTDALQAEPKKSGNGRIIAGSILILIGVIFFLERFVTSFDFGDIFPFVFVIVGIALILNSIKK